LIHELKQEYTIVIVTHNMQQASRVSDRTGLAGAGEPGHLIEIDDTDTIFTNPTNKETEDYISGRFGWAGGRGGGVAGRAGGAEAWPAGPEGVTGRAR